MTALDQASRFVAGLEAAGISLRVVGRRVKLAGHGRLLTHRQAAQLSSLKSEVIRLLRARDCAGPGRGARRLEVRAEQVAWLRIFPPPEDEDRVQPHDDNVSPSTGLDLVVAVPCPQHRPSREVWLP